MSPKVFGALNLGFGLIGLASTLFSWRLYFAPLDTQSGVMAELLRSDAFFATSMRIITIPGIIFAALQVASGIGLFTYREWARKLAIVCAVYGLLAGIFAGYLSVVHTLPFTMEYTLRNSPQVGNPQFEHMMRSMMKAAGMAGAFMGLIYPACVLFFLTRPKVRVHCIAASTKPTNLIA